LLSFKPAPDFNIENHLLNTDFITSQPRASLFETDLESEFAISYVIQDGLGCKFDGQLGLNANVVNAVEFVFIFNRVFKPR